MMLLFWDHRSTSLNQIRSVVSVAIYPLQVAVSSPVRWAQDLKTTVVSYDELKEENARLKEKQLIDSVKLQKFNELQKENIRLRGLLENSFKLGEQVLIAELLAVNLVPYEHVVIVNKGTRFGVHAKQAVLDAHGVVGQVIRALPLSSEVMLITDPEHAIPVQVNRNGLRTIAIGTGRLDQLSLPFLPNNADIRAGDLLVTSGLGGTFPQGYPVAIVDHLTVQPDKPFAEISATPKALLDRSRELLIDSALTTEIPTPCRPPENA